MSTRPIPPYFTANLPKSITFKVCYNLEVQYFKLINKTSVITGLGLTILSLFAIVIFINNTQNKLEVKEFQASEDVQTLSPTPTFTPESVISEPTSTPTVKSCIGDCVDAFITFFGWPDNSPSGNGIYFKKSQFPETVHEVAGGVGTYQDPVTFASDPDLYPAGTKIYLPYLKKYAIMEDVCAGCVENWKNNGRIHVDIWMESGSTFESELSKCQGYWTRRKVEIEIDPPRGKVVDTKPLFNNLNGACLSDI